MVPADKILSKVGLGRKKQEDIWGKSTSSKPCRGNLQHKQTNKQSPASQSAEGGTAWRKNLTSHCAVCRNEGVMKPYDD